MNGTNRMSKGLLIFAALVFVAGACSAPDEGPAPDSTPAPESDTDVDPSSHGEFAVLYKFVADELEADSEVELLQNADLDGFVTEPARSGGFNVLWPGLTRAEAMQVVIEIGMTPDVFGGVIFETAELR